MPSQEPNNSMDELLRAYASKRREQAGPPLPLHPATRKLLQDEVRRMSGAAPPPARRRWAGAWLATATALGCGLAVLVAVLLTLSRRAPNQPPAGSFSSMEPNGTAANNPAMPATLSADKLVPPQAAPPPVASAVSDVAARRFVQVRETAGFGGAPSGPSHPSVASNILAVFQMERIGQNVRIVDADGSIYQGPVVRGAPRAGVAAKDARKEAAWDFKVTGINNNLKQNVVFIGSVFDMPQSTDALHMPAFAATAKPLAPAQRAPQGRAAGAAGAFQAAQSPLIRGTVRVGEGKEFEIEAAPPAPR